MERRNLLKMAFAVATCAAAFAATVQAAPLAPLPLSREAHSPVDRDAQPAVTTGDEVGRLKPEQVHWHHRHWGWHHRHWHHRHWGRHHRHWHHRHWGWRHHHWHHHHWRRW
ncbi:twin-arginine translocation signal domain-containing protein [Bradyrhizobium sp. AUGA SZCCT0051]|nr:twin-arginine translocation signal domain-containing protein [Bradyrhizobium sp. AUGA SZCCT0124]MBR1309448.1 twin-arginine translocation signal domain-containing protein [Bradyrhizobium sp. AUGA SZCCT0051]MBR1339589.1 twin-arginine translocation signal domain-containing protein [Bradyrhizobium sp. AUGA SZCCT0105]MBR1354196.1 twin-arginine translocation signal domain-containing protein [Bradyrhizobium sp. AUGA SZCCT0045]